VVLRKAEHLKIFEGIKDSDLTASELRKKSTFEDKEVGFLILLKFCSFGLIYK